MVHDPTNPYRPPHPIESESKPISVAGRLSFDGNVSQSDVYDLVDVPFRFYVFRFTGVILVGFLFAVFGIPTIASPNPDLRVGAIALCTGVVVLVIDRLNCRRTRSKRLTKRFPSLLGTRVGHLDDYGLTIKSRLNNQWLQYSWAVFNDIEVHERGIRLGWGGNQMNTVILPSNCFVGYHRDRTKDFVDRFMDAEWKASPEESLGPVFRVQPNWTDQPAGTIRFAKTSPSKKPISKTERRLLMAIRIIQFAANATGIFCCFVFPNPWIVVPCFLVPLAVLVSSTRLHARAIPASYEIEQWGWISRGSVHIESPGRTINVEWNEASSRRFIKDRFYASFPEEPNAFTVGQNDVATNDWLRLKAWLSNT